MAVFMKRLTNTKKTQNTHTDLRKASK